MVAGHKPKDQIWERDYIIILKLFKITQKLPSHKVCMAMTHWPVSILGIYVLLYIHTHIFGTKIKKNTPTSYNAFSNIFSLFP